MSRKKLFEYYLNRTKNNILEDQITKWAGLSIGLTGADISQIVNTAGEIAVQRDI